MASACPPAPSARAEQLAAGLGRVTAASADGEPAPTCPQPCFDGTCLDLHSGLAQAAASAPTSLIHRAAHEHPAEQHLNCPPRVPEGAAPHAQRLPCLSSLSHHRVLPRLALELSWNGRSSSVCVGLAQEGGWHKSSPKRSHGLAAPPGTGLLPALLRCIYQSPLCCGPCWLVR